MNETPAISASSMFGKFLIKGTYNESPVKTHCTRSALHDRFDRAAGSDDRELVQCRTSLLVE